jgi:hypothetical protein
MRKLLTSYFTLTAAVLFCQHPVLKVYIDSLEVNKQKIHIEAFVKTQGQFYSVLSTENGQIILPENIELEKIEAVKFIVNTEIIMFQISKILEDLKKTPEKKEKDELKIIFKDLKKWELHIDNFQYYNEAELLASARKGEKRTSIYKNYKIYGLRTTSFKYYVVKA